MRYIKISNRDQLKIKPKSEIPYHFSIQSQAWWYQPYFPDKLSPSLPQPKLFLLSTDSK